MEKTKTQTNRVFLESFEFKVHELFIAMKTEFQQICQQNSDRIQGLEDEVRTLNKKIEKLEEKSDESEAYSRRDTTILSGNDLPAWSSTENCTQVVMDIVKSKLKVTINSSDNYIDRPSYWEKSCQQPRPA